jgi:hypothetical protein
MFSIPLPKHFIRNNTIITISGCVLLVIILVFTTHMPLIYALASFGIAIFLGGIIGFTLSLFYSKFLFNNEYNANIIETNNNIEITLDKEIQVNFELNIKDILSYKIYSYDHYIPIKKSRRLMRRVALLAFFIEILSAAILYLTYTPIQLLLVIIFVVIAMFTFLWSLLSPWIIKKATIRAILGGYDKSLNSLIGKHSLAITPEAITDKSDFGELTIHWKAINQIESAERYIFIYPSTNIPYIIPKSAFIDEATFTQFINTSKYYQQKALK